ncbi:hypothetical protein F5Y04DRAFT_277539 [Hypomontagnella monticulosa]|nr:hypothetical protein F5Y04DRAFT_277539 [Hypomontagnella monticulosa]
MSPTVVIVDVWAMVAVLKGVVIALAGLAIAVHFIEYAVDPMPLVGILTQPTYDTPCPLAEPWPAASQENEPASETTPPTASPLHELDATEPSSSRANTFFKKPGQILWRSWLVARRAFGGMGVEVNEPLDVVREILVMRLWVVFVCLVYLGMLIVAVAVMAIHTV